MNQRKERERKLHPAHIQTRGHLEDELLTICEVAAMLKLPVATLRKWRADGGGPEAFRVGKWLRYRRSKVEEFIRALEEK